MNQAHAEALANDANKLRAWIDSVPDLPYMATAKGQTFKVNLFTYLDDLKGDVREFQEQSREEVA